MPSSIKWSVVFRSVVDILYTSIIFSALVTCFSYLNVSSDLVLSITQCVNYSLLKWSRIRLSHHLNTRRLVIQLWISSQYKLFICRLLLLLLFWFVELAAIRLATAVTKLDRYQVQKLACESLVACGSESSSAVLMTYSHRSINVFIWSWSIAATLVWQQTLSSASFAYQQLHVDTGECVCWF
jgi:hypothetical protein